MKKLPLFIFLLFSGFQIFNAQSILSFEFTSDDEGWNRQQARCATSWNSQGYLDVTTNGNNDPFFYREPKIEFSASNFNFIELRIKNGTADNLGGVLLFTSSGNINVPVSMKENSTAFETIVIDLATIPNFSNSLNITDIRLDPNVSGAAGVISYDYVRFLETPTNVVSATSLSISGPSTITTNETAQFSADITPSNASYQTVDYSVSDTNIATINSSGLLIPVSAGTVTVTGTTKDGSNISDTKQITITQAPNTIIGWEFDSDDDGWNKTPLRCSTEWNSNGYLDITTIGENDPSVRNVNAQSFAAANANFLEIRVKNGTDSELGSIIFFVSGGGVRTANFSMTKNSTDFETIVVDLPASVTNWSSNDVFTDIRLDANNNGAVGVVSFDYIRFNKQNTLSTKNLEILSNINLFPNPVSNGEQIKINLEKFTTIDKLTVSVSDLTGKLLYRKQVSGGKLEQIPTNNLNTGVYLVSLKNNSSFKNFKILIK